MYLINSHILYKLCQFDFYVVILYIYCFLALEIKLMDFLLTLAHKVFAYFLLISLIFVSSHTLCFYYTFSQIAEAPIRHIGLGKINKQKENMLLCHFKM